MEIILQRISNECSAGKFPLVGGAAKEAFEALIAQQGNSAYEMHQLREKCLAAIELALDSKSTRIVRLATDALQFILRDNQLHSLPESKENAEETLPMQVVHTLHDLPSWSHDSDLQCHCFTILLQVTSNSLWTIDSRAICKIVQLCISTFTASNQLSTRMAARATVIQTVNSFCTTIYNRVDVETPTNQDDYKKMFQEITKLMNYCCTKLKAIISSPQECPPLLLMLDAIHAILSSQDEKICNYDEFLELIWQEFIPIVINILGDPSQMELTSSTCASDVSRGRGVGGLGGDQVIFGAPEVAKSAYRICGELLRLLGRLTSMRSVLEALFHRFLLFPPPEKRLESLKVLKSILENPRRIVDLGVNLCQPMNETSTSRSDLTLWQIVLDCLVDCTMQSNVEISTMAVRCMTSFISSLIEFCNENSNFLNDKYVSEINKRFVRLTDADFDGVDYSSFREKYHSETDLSLQPNDDETSSVEKIDQEELAEDNFDDNLKSIAGRIGASLRSTTESNEDSVVAYLDRIRSAWDQNLKLKSHPTLQKCSSFDKRELDAASDFVNDLIERLPEWNSSKSTIELDVQLQSFAAETCEKFMLKQLGLLQRHGSMYEAAIYNADALYLVSYASLDLCHSLFMSKNQEIFESNTVVLNSKFVEAVTNTGSISYVSLSFIDAVYRLLNERDVFSLAKISKPSSVFSDLIKDYHGRNGDLLSDFLRLERTSKRRNIEMNVVATIKFARRLITTSWSAIVEILSVLIDRANATNVLPTLSLCSGGSRLAGTKNPRVAEGILASLEGLQRLLVLCPQLELKNKCGWIFRKLVEASCPLEELRRVVQKEQEKSNGFSLKLSLGRSTGWEIQTPHALSIQLILDNAIQVGSGDAACWNPIVRCIEYVCEFEHRYFTCASTNRKFFSSSTKSKDSPTSLNKFDVDEDDFVITMPMSPVRNGENILEAIEQIDGVQNNAGVLSDKATAKVLCILSLKIERFFEDCCRRLNLDALKEFIKCLVSASQSNLFYGSSMSRGRLPPWSLLERLGTILNRIARSGRPLVHLMTIWGVAAPHFIEAACASNSEFTCRTIDFLRQSISALLESGANFPSFHFNESLFQPFQTILCLELCGEETFDRIVCAIAELVECYKKEIHTGWKSLFGALKAVRCSYMFSKQEMSAEDLTHLHTAVVDVFSCFLRHDNLKVFCRASGECIQCLLRFLVDDENDVETSTNAIDDETASKTISPNPDFAKTALCFLRQCHALLVSLYVGPTDDVVVHLIRRLTPKDHSLQTVDCDLPHLNDSSHSLPSLASFLSDQQNLFGWNLSPFFLEQRLEEPSLAVPWATFTVGKQLVCEAWVDLIEGLVGSIATCPRYLQPEVIDCVYSIVGAMLDLPGLAFGAYCMNHLVLPMLQRWLRRQWLNDVGWRENIPSVRNFKQCLGLTVDTVVKYLESDPEASCNRLLLSQTFDLLTECVSMPSEVVARLGCSSFRHIINSLKHRLTSKSWDVVCRCMWRVGGVTLHSIRLLMSYFAVGSRHYAGDMGTVQVAMRKDSNPSEAARFRVLAQQVFLVDSQKYEENLEDHPDKLSQSYRSIVFLLNPSDMCANENVIRLPFRNIVFGLLSHQLYLQLIGTILAEGTNIKLTALSSTLTRHVYSSENSTEKLSGCLEFLTNEQVSSLLLCLDASFATAYEFDRRPGLKFLLQKVFSSPVSSNLYKQAVTCWTFKALTLYQLGSLAVFVSPTLTVKQIKEISDDECLVDAVSLPMDDLAKTNGVFYLRLMCRSYLNVCQTMCDIESALIGGESHADRLASYALDVVLPNADVRCDDDEATQKSSENQSRTSFTPTSSRSGSSRGSPTKARRPLADVEEGETVYSLASTDVVQAFLKDYKRHKQRNTLGIRSTKQEIQRVNPFDESSTTKTLSGVDKQATTTTSRDGVEFCEDLNLCREVLDSLMKVNDGEAACLAWSEMGASLLQLVLTLPNDKFRLMLPTVFQSATLMTSRTNNRRLKMIATDLFYRLAEVYQIFDE